MIEQDTQYQEDVITSVSRDGDGDYSLQLESGWGFYAPADSPVVPEPGMTIRMYGRGIGYGVRGLVIAGKTVYYRTEEEDREHNLRETYGASCQEWLDRWDVGRSVWSVEMGGFGPAYEQCLQILAVELLRELVKGNVPPDELGEKTDAQLDAVVNRLDKTYGFSGAQVGAARNLAFALYHHGPVAALTMDKIKDRLIQVSSYFPQVVEVPSPSDVPWNHIRTKEVAKFVDSHGGDLWGEHPDYPKSDWMYEVQNGDTFLGYWECVMARLDSEASAD